MEQGSRIWTYAYDALGRLETLTDPLTQETAFDYDDADRVTSETRPDEEVIATTYDAMGNATSITPPDQPAHEMTYTPVQLLASYEPPDIGIDTTSTWEYDGDRKPTLITWPDDSTLTYDYDSAGRVTSLAFGQPNEEEQVEWAYHSQTGQLESVSGPAGVTVTYGYDGELLTSIAWSGTIEGAISRTYDNDFRIASETLEQQMVEFDYDDDGLLTHAGDLDVAREAETGRIKGTSLDLVTDEYGYDPTYGELDEYVAKYDGTAFYSVEYERDPLGRVLEKAETMDQESAVVYEYSYDDLGRLFEVSIDNNVVSTYTYDENGNRTAHNSVMGTYDAQDRLTAYGDVEYEYTAYGQLATKTDTSTNPDEVTTYEYDALGNLRRVVLPDETEIEYVVDGLNRRVGKKVDDVVIQGFLYEDQLRIAAELDGSGNVVARFVCATTPNVPDYAVFETVTYRIISDHLGSPRLLVDVADGDIDYRIDYDEFGNPTFDPPSGEGLIPFGFAGGLHDPDTQLVRFGARDYDPVVGRWTAKDPILFGGGSSNVLAYVDSDPVNRIDSTGRILVPVAAWGTECFLISWYAAEAKFDDDKTKHCYASCLHARCMLGAFPWATLGGGIGWELANGWDSDSMADIHADMQGILNAYEVAWCDEQCKEDPEPPCK